MNKLQLNQLMIKIKEDRDEMAFSSLFDFLAPKIKGYYIQNGLSSENAEELTQEVFSIIWAKSDSYNPSKSALSTWAYTIARNKKVDFWSRQQSIHHYFLKHQFPSSFLTLFLVEMRRVV